MEKPLPKQTYNTVNRTIRTAKRFNVFWERWVAHGVEDQDLMNIRGQITTKVEWDEKFLKLATARMNAGTDSLKVGDDVLAQKHFRSAGLFYNLLYWIDPLDSAEKIERYRKCLRATCKADELSPYPIRYHSLVVDGFRYEGRIRTHEKARGCVIILVPIDSSKEELIQYEEDFLKNGFSTVMFDGPGQGESFLLNKIIGTRERWEQFTFALIEESNDWFSSIPLYLFGTSLGASWTLYGSAHPAIKKTVAVSPASELEKMNMPSYFLERMECSCLMAKEVHAIPHFHMIHHQSPVLLFHGKQDGMVPTKVMKELYEGIYSEKKMLEYEDEGHCCNSHLAEIRKLSIEWFLEE